MRSRKLAGTLLASSILLLLTSSALAATPRFRDVTASAGVRFRHSTGGTGRFHYPEIMGAGVILFDSDGDGDLDIYFLNGNYLSGRQPDPSLTNAFYRNDSSPGRPAFADLTRESGLADAGYGQGGEAADFDGDGDVDLYVTNIGRDVLFRNDGSNRFARVALPAREGWGQTCAAFDYDHDGDLDLFVANYLTYDSRTEPIGSSVLAGKLVHDYRGPQVYQGKPSILLRNDGALKFVDVTREAGLYRTDSKGMGLVCVDLDGDGWIDVYQANDTVDNFLFHNQRGKFQEIGLISGTAVSSSGSREASMGVDTADIDGDGRPDLIVPCLTSEVHTLYKNEWPWFSDESVEHGLHHGTRDKTGFSPSFIDYDNDGDPDLFISCGRVRMWTNMATRQNASFLDRYGESQLLLENDGRGRFQPTGAAGGAYFSAPHVGRGTATADLDGDGRLDIVVVHAAAPPAILLNETGAGHWLALRLVGGGQNRDAIGARVVARVGARTQHYWVRGGGSYLSVGDRRVHIGLGEAQVADRIEITWPLGRTQVLENVAGDRVLTVEEP